MNHRETERNYVMGHHNVDAPSRWESEGGYFRGLGDEGSQSDSSTWVDALTQVLPVAASIYQQDQFNKMNRDLISAGKPPISAQTYMQNFATPSASVQVGPTADAKKWIMYGGIALLGLVGLRAAKII